MSRVHKGGGAVGAMVRMLHQGQINLVSIPPATPLLPDEPGGGEPLHGFNDLPIAHLHFLCQGTAGKDNKYRSVLIDPAVEPGELEAVEQKGIGYLGLQGQTCVMWVGKEPAGSGCLTA